MEEKKYKKINNHTKLLTIILDVIEIILYLICIGMFNRTNNFEISRYEIILGIALFFFVLGNFFLWRRKTQLNLSFILRPYPPRWDETSKGYHIFYYVKNFGYLAITMGLLIYLLFFVLD